MVKNSISSRLMKYFLCIVLFPVTILSLIIFGVCKNSIISLVQKNANESLALIEYNIEQQFLQYDSLVYFISRDRQIQNVARYDNVEEFNQNMEEQKMLRNLLAYYQSTGYQVSRAVISYENGILLTAPQKECIEHRPETQEWYRLCKTQPGKGHVLSYLANDSIYDGMDSVFSDVITVCRSIEDKNGNFIGAVSIEMYGQILEQSMSNILSRKGSYVYIVNKNQEVIYSPVVRTIQEVSEKDFYSVKIFEPRTEWTIVGVMNMEEYLRQLNTLVSVLLITLGVLAGVMVWMSVKVSDSIVKPLQMLQGLMKQAEEGDLSIRFQENAPREVQELGNRFNAMIEKLDYYVERVRVEQKAKRKAEIEALQANIKPHFLYNTLDTIHWMAKDYQAADIVETVDSLATLFRIALSKGSETITVEKEIQHVASYLQIQKTRYEDKFTYDIYVQQNAKQLMVQKLILQPLVENAIYHGIKASGRKGTICIRVWTEENAIYLTVEDDGKGMSGERLQKVRESLNNFQPEEQGAYGVVNVHQRLVMSYGAPYGLYLISEEGVGTTALIYHPVI